MRTRVRKHFPLTELFTQAGAARSGLIKTTLRHLVTYCDSLFRSIHCCLLAFDAACRIGVIDIIDINHGSSIAVSCYLS